MVKKRKLTLLITILSILSLVSVGFAAWVITNDANKTAEGNIRVDVVEDKRLGMTANIKDNESIIFGAKAQTSGDYSWLKYEQSVDENGKALDEHLTVYLSLTIENYSYLADEEALIITVKEETGVYAKALEAGYVAELPSMKISKQQLINYAVAEIQEVINSGVNPETEEALTTDEIVALQEEITALQAGTAEVLACDIPIEFSWGATFNTLNPIDYYNSFEYDEELANGAKELLDDLFVTLNNSKYVVQVEAKAK